MRIDKFLVEVFPTLTRSDLARLIDHGHILVNDHHVKKSYKLKSGDRLDITLPEPEISEIIPQKIPLNILFEDHSIIILNKTQGSIVHPGAGNPDGTLVNGLLAHCEDLRGIGGVIRPGVVHRLDKDTSGVLVFAKSQQALNYLADQFKEHTNHREYLAIVWGKPDNQGTIDTLYGRSDRNRIKYTGKVTRGKRAITHFYKIKQYRHCALIKAVLETGRTHQIRVHLSERGHPLLGDQLYGFGVKHYQFFPQPLYQIIKQLPGQMLHARKLGIKHPDTKKLISFTTPPPEIFIQLLKGLKKWD